MNTQLKAVFNFDIYLYSGFSYFLILNIKNFQDSEALKQKQLWQKEKTSIYTGDLSLINSIIHPYAHLYIHPFIHSFIHSFIYSLIISPIRSFIQSFIHSFAHSFLDSFTHLLTRYFIHSLIPVPFLHSPIHSFNLFINPLIHTIVYKYAICSFSHSLSNHIIIYLFIHSSVFLNSFKLRIIEIIIFNCMYSFIFILSGRLK